MNLNRKIHLAGNKMEYCIVEIIKGKHARIIPITKGIVYLITQYIMRHGIDDFKVISVSFDEDDGFPTIEDEKIQNKIKEFSVCEELTEFPSLKGGSFKTFIKSRKVVQRHLSSSDQAILDRMSGYAELSQMHL